MGLVGMWVVRFKAHGVHRLVIPTSAFTELFWNSVSFFLNGGPCTYARAHQNMANVEKGVTAAHESLS